jgi:sterol desaturase/sphingolipid hydroxylase (fatty acid hydroxylase superfamily)
MVFHLLNAAILASRIVFNGCLYMLGSHLYSPLNDMVVHTDQLQREQGWYHGILMQWVALYVLHYGLQFYTQVPTWFQLSDLSYGLLYHVFMVKPLYYLVHVWLHWPSVFKWLHSYHHRSRHTLPSTGLVQHWVEHLLYVAVFGHLFLTCVVTGYQPSILGMLLYPLVFDACNAVGHVQVECFPRWWRTSGCFWFFYSPSYHQVHHSAISRHFCLFMPVYDLLGGTYHSQVYQQMFEDRSQARHRAPTSKVVFLVHTVGPASLHLPMLSTKECTFRLRDMSLLRTYVGHVALRLVSLLGIDVVTMARSRFVLDDQIVLVETRCLGQTPQEMKRQPARTNARLFQEIRSHTSTPTPTLVLLGADTKATELNTSGQALQAQVAYPPVYHGNGLTTIWCLANLRMYLPILRYRYGPQMPIIIIGASSSIGQRLVSFVLDRGYPVSFVTSDRARYESFCHKDKAALTFVDSNNMQQLHAALRVSPVCLLCMIVDNRSHYHPDVTIFNFTAAEYVGSGHERVVDMGFGGLVSGSPLHFHGRYHHALERGRFHICMMSGVLALLTGDQNHEKPLETYDMSDDYVAQVWRDCKQKYGLTTLAPSRSFSTGVQTQCAHSFWVHCRKWDIPVEIETKTRSGFSRYMTKMRFAPSDVLEFIGNTRAIS